jgi:hypothetical protein
MQTPESQCKQSLLNVNAGTRAAEKAKTEKYKAQRGHCGGSSSNDSHATRTGRELRRKSLSWA